MGFREPYRPEDPGFGDLDNDELGRFRSGKRTLNVVRAGRKRVRSRWRRRRFDLQQVRLAPG